MLPGDDRAARRVLTVCLAAGATTPPDQSVLDIAVPALRQSLSAGATDVQWIVSDCSSAFGLALVPGGSPGDVRGRRHLFLVGLSTFVPCGLVAATGTQPATVVVARLVQGAGAGLVNSQVIGTLQDVFHGLDRARALGRSRSMELRRASAAVAPEGIVTRSGTPRGMSDAGRLLGVRRCGKHRPPGERRVRQVLAQYGRHLRLGSGPEWTSGHRLPGPGGARSG